MAVLRPPTPLEHHSPSPPPIQSYSKAHFSCSGNPAASTSFFTVHFFAWFSLCMSVCVVKIPVRFLQ